MEVVVWVSVVVAVVVVEVEAEAGEEVEKEEVLVGEEEEGRVEVEARDAEYAHILRDVHATVEFKLGGTSSIACTFLVANVFKLGVTIGTSTLWELIFIPLGKRGVL